MPAKEKDLTMIQLLINLCFATIITIMVFYVFRDIGTIYHDHMWRKTLTLKDLRLGGRAGFDASTWQITTYDNWHGICYEKPYGIVRKVFCCRVLTMDDNMCRIIQVQQHQPSESIPCDPTMTWPSTPSSPPLAAVLTPSRRMAGNAVARRNSFRVRPSPARGVVQNTRYSLKKMWLGRIDP